MCMKSENSTKKYEVGRHYMRQEGVESLDRQQRMERFDGSANQNRSCSTSIYCHFTGVVLLDEALWYRLRDEGYCYH